MTDVYDAATRSRTMSRVRATDTRPEMALRRAAHARGLRFRLHGRAGGGLLPGKPDLVFAGRKAAVFVHGCFWHRHPGCPRATTPASRRDYWDPKFARNVARDARARDALLALGWRVAVIWECALTRGGAPAAAAALDAWLAGDDPSLEIPAPPEDRDAPRAPTRPAAPQG